MTDVVDPGVTTSPVEPADQGTPNGSEAVTNPGTPSEQQIPLERFQEVNNSLKEERAAREQLAQQVETLQNRFTPQNEEPEIDPDVQKVLDAYAKKNGFVSKAELDQVAKENELRIQVQNDIVSLSKELPDFDHSKVLAYANENGIPINNKASLRAIYRDMNFDSITDATKKAAIAEFQQSGRTTGEVTSTATQTPTPISNTPKSRIQAAREKLGIKL